jgi:hypothetical protein
MATNANANTCPICVSDFTSSTRKPVSCPFCPNVACTKCVRQFLSDRPLAPRCMHCSEAWNDEVISDQVSPAFFKGTIVNARRKAVFDAQVARLPENQLEAAFVIACDKTLEVLNCELDLCKKILADRHPNNRGEYHKDPLCARKSSITEHIRRVTSKRGEVLSGLDAEPLFARRVYDSEKPADTILGQYSEYINDHESDIETRDATYAMVKTSVMMFDVSTRNNGLVDGFNDRWFPNVAATRRGLATPESEAEAEAKAKAKARTIPCATKDCRGFVTELEPLCGICCETTCPECHCSKAKATADTDTDEAHVCDPNEVETVKALMKDTKPCPECHVPIFKIDGCDQMWCTKCHVAFSWVTGEVCKGAIHNPHYFDWMRSVVGPNIPRQPGDNGNANANALGEFDDEEEMEFWRNADYLDYRTVINHPILARYLFTDTSGKAVNIVTNVIRQAMEVRQYGLLLDYREYMHDTTEHKLRGVRVKYLVDQIDDRRFRTMVTNITNWSAYVEAMRDIQNRFAEDIQRTLRERLNVLTLEEFDFTATIAECAAIAKWGNDAISEVKEKIKVIGPKTTRVLLKWK